MKPEILYIGNQLAKHGYTPTSVEYLGEQLQGSYALDRVSDKKNWLLRFFDTFWHLAKGQWHYRLILIDTYSTWNFYWAFLSGLMAKLLKIPYIPILHGGNLPERYRNNPLLTQKLLMNAHTIVSPSFYLKDFFEKKGFNTRYIPNFIEVAYYPFCERRTLKPKILWVRAFHAIYNPEMAIEVLAYLIKEYPQAELCMVGPDKDGSKAQVEAKAKELGMEKNLMLTGKLSKTEWIEKAKDYSIFINTTNFDNQPVSIIEGWALGLPIVSTNAGGLPYLIDNERTGLLVEKNDTEGMAKQIIRLIKTPDLANRLSINCRNKAEEEFDWKNVQPKWNTLINEALQDS